MAEKFVDRQSAYPNRYKVTKADGTIEYITLERADEPTVVGTPLNAETFNKIIDELSSVESDEVIPIERGGTNATDGATGLKNLFAAGATVLSSHQYGDALPTPGTPGRIFFKKVSG
jgi:hypothetical protein